VGPSRKSETILALWRKQMAHDHGNEYQVRIIHADGTEKLSVWMNSEEQVAQAMAAVHKAQGEAYWLRKRNVLCPDCFDKEQIIILECPITDIVSTIPPPRFPLSGGSGVEELVRIA
jgi:nicotinic acid mononucleotide adenylyltransferase